MKYYNLGNTDLKVSKLCFGALTIGPLQTNLPVEVGSKVIEHAVNLGVNFIDTAELYDTYEYIKKALRNTQKDLIVATKSYSYNRELMAKSLEKARKELDKDVIDIFLLHEQESILTVKGHWDAVEYLMDSKAKGIVKAIGLSTHTIKGVEAAIQFPELEIIHPIVNYQGLGILDGDINEMLALLKKAKEMGKGIYGMKPIGGGNLIGDVNKALTWAFSRPELDAVAVGMQSFSEVNINIALLVGKNPDYEDLLTVKKKRRTLHIEKYCEGCGQCIDKCFQNALQLSNGQVQVNNEKCLFCGYCGAACPNFAIKII
ncbi:MAG: uncharacterized protein PWQ67_1626 [Clostridia bacterium]|jgi:predicted aldo/keto reductase-like oxidoreductase|nr:uncharacterized protein [Clostridia bacterium]MDN5323172.1 uncharacterized protein [Clostridia bacterium]